MSKPRYNWWPFVLNMIRDYPSRHKSPLLKVFPEQDQREHDAVQKAIEMTKKQKNSEIRLKIVEMSLWTQTKTLPVIARDLFISEQTARRYRYRFILLVAHCYGFLSLQEYEAAVRRQEE